MRLGFSVISLVVGIAVCQTTFAQQTQSSRQPLLRQQLAKSQGLDLKKWQIDGVEREGLIHIPKDRSAIPRPVVFVFHGHGGTMYNVARSFAIEKHWPQAIVVYLQGLNTPGQLTDPEGKKPGWQKGEGDQGDRDLKLFDEVLESLKKENIVDLNRIYSTGHSNGGGFTYLLLASRGDKLAAIAPSASASSRFVGKLQAKPVFHIAGENDTLVKYEWQKATIATMKKLNGCESERPWGELCTEYVSPNKTPVITMIHSQNHKFPADAPKLIAKFFQEHQLAEVK